MLGGEITNTVIRSRPVLKSSMEFKTRYFKFLKVTHCQNSFAYSFNATSIEDELHFPSYFTHLLIQIKTRFVENLSSHYLNPIYSRVFSRFIRFVKYQEKEFICILKIYLPAVLLRIYHIVTKYLL
jgi:hypothetical protein